MARNDYSAFIDNLKTIYGNANLSDQTLSQLGRTWKKNPSLITNAALQKKNAINDAALQEATTQAQQNMKNITSKYWDDVRAMEDASAAQDEKDYMDAGYTYDINKGWTKPAALAPKVFNEKHWLGRAKQFGFNSIDEVKKWQSKNGLTADGMFGGNSEAKMLELQKAAENDPANNPYVGRMQGTTTRNAQQQAASNYKKPTINNNIFSSDTFNSAGKAFTGTFNNMEEFNNAFTDWYGKRNGFWQGGSSNEGRKWDAARDNMLQQYLKFHNLNSLPQQRSSKFDAGQEAIIRSKYSPEEANRILGINRNGGIINKFAGGGKQMNEQQMQEAFVQFLIQDAQAQGIDIQSEEDMKAYVQQLGKEGLAAKQQEFMQRMQGTPSRKLGGHLAYLNKLKGNCPDGEEMVYMKEGGRVCSKCMKKAEKAKPGTKLEKNAISDFKEKRKIAPSDTVHVNGQPRSLTDSQNRPLVKGMKTYSASEYQKDMKDAKKGKKDAANRVEKSDMKTAYSCGGATKKLVKKKK